MSFRYGACGRKREPDGGALAGDAFDRQRAAVQRHQLAADREPKSGAAIAPAYRGVRLGEGFAKRGHRRRIDADAGIRHDQGKLAIRGRRPVRDRYRPSA